MTAAGANAKADGSDSSSQSAPSLTTDWAGAAQKVRDTSSTLLKTFAGLATLLLGSGPLLANLSNLHADSRGVLALTGGGLALLGLGVIIWQAANVSLTKTTDVGNLLNPAPGDKVINKLLARIQAPDVCAFYLNGSDLKGLTADRAHSVWALGEQQLALARDPGTDASTATFISAQIAQSQANIGAIDGLLRNVEDWANYEKIADTFRQARPKMFAAGAVAVVGVALWLGLVSSGSSSSSSATASGSATATTVTASTSLGSGTLATLTWKTGKTATAQKRDAKYRGSLKKGTVSMADCKKVGVLILGGTGTSSDPWQLSTLPGNTCPVQMRFPATSSLASLKDADPAGQINATVKFDQDEHLKASDFAVWLIFGVLGTGLVIVTRRAIVARRQNRGGQ
jgi:hypothetical protein